MAVLDCQQCVLDPLEHGLRLLHCGDVDIVLEEADPADRADDGRCARSKHLQQLETKIAG